MSADAERRDFDRRDAEFRGVADRDAGPRDSEVRDAEQHEGGHCAGGHAGAERCDSARHAAERVLRELAPRVLGTLVRRGGDFSSAEDALQEALVAALEQWPTRGVPQNPGGWLFQVASRALVDRRRSEAARERREAEVASWSPESKEWVNATDMPDASELGLDPEDDTLLLLFTCCHPALTDASATALTLRAVGGLTTAEIARAFLVPESTMAQRISRAKESIRASGVSFELPEASERGRRLDAVLHVLYLIFNEGYAASSGPELVRVDLSREALRLARALQRVAPEHSEAAGLLALMLLTDARREARTSARGELIPLDEQDRSRWDRAAIAEGSALITATLARGQVGSYQLQAAIAALHDEAPSTDATDWPQIQALYGLLLRISDNPIVALNHAVATAMVQGPEAGLRLVDALARDPRIAGHYRLDAVRAHFFERAGDRAAAVKHFTAAADATASLAERDYLLAKAAKPAGR
ncbi:MAG: RNA polymerase sigma factor [Planctomycetes bacterium]|nr:RNA polymerase sigma factor [Planctomycetota bacterium]